MSSKNAHKVRNIKNEKVQRTTNILKDNNT